MTCLMRLESPLSGTVVGCKQHSYTFEETIFSDRPRQVLGTKSKAGPNAQ